MLSPVSKSSSENEYSDCPPTVFTQFFYMDKGQITEDSNCIIDEIPKVTLFSHMHLQQFVLGIRLSTTTSYT